MISEGSLFVRYKNPLGVVLALLLLGGAYAYTRLKSDLFPNVTFPKVKVIADNGQQPVDKMMLTVTRPLEEAIKRVQGLQLVRSTTSRGSAEISAFFDWNADIDLGQQRLESRINQIRSTLPPDVQLSIEKMNPSILPIAGYSLEGDRSQIELKMIALYTVKPFLSQVAGVSDVAIIGGKNKEFQLVLQPDKMSQLGITPQTVATVLSNTNFITSNGYIQDYNRLYLTLTDVALDDLQELENLIVVSLPQRVVRISDIARVQVGEEREYIRIKANGKNVPLVAVLKQPEANLVDVAAELERKVAELNRLLPRGVVLRPYYQQADFVKEAVRSIRDVLWVGLALAIVVAVLFLRSLKSSAVLLLTIPLTLSLTLLLLYALGYDFNIMTLGAIAAAIGLIIDDAIVVVEQIHRMHEEFPGRTPRELTGRAIGYLLPAMVGSSLSTIVIFLPFVLMTGIAGAYFRILTETMIITLAASFLVTWIGLPTLYLLLSRDRPSGRPPVEHSPRRQVWVRAVIRYPVIAVVLMLIMGGLLWWITPRLPSGFLPEMDEGSIVLDFDSPPGTSLEATDRMLTEVDHILDSIPEVRSYSRRVGTQMGFFITEPSRGDYLIQLTPERQRSTEEVADDIRGRVEAVLPALIVDFGQVIGDMLGDLMASVQPIEIKIFGDDRTVLQDLSRQVAAAIEQVPGTADVFDGIVIAGPSVIVEPEVALLKQFQLEPSDFQFQLQTQLEGMVVGVLPEPQQMTPIRMIYPGRDQATVQRIAHTRFFLPNGQLLPINRFARVHIEPGQAEIERENLKNMGVVTARLNNRDLGSTLKDIRTALRDKVPLPAGYRIEYGGAYAQQQQAFQELLIILALASLLVFSVILFLFRKFFIALFIIVLAALGASGSVTALYLTGTPLNVGSYVGIIMIIGIIGENAIFTYFQYARQRAEADVRNAIVYSLSNRLRPKLMTALGAIAALLPLAMGVGTGAQLHQPLAIAVIGGLIAALPLLLVVLPAFMRLLEKD